MSFLMGVLVLQGIVIGLIALVLRGLLNRMLRDMALRYLEVCTEAQVQGVACVRVETAGTVDSAYRQRVQTAVQRRFPSPVTVDFQVRRAIRGGAVIHVGGHVIDCSLKDRLERAFHTKTQE